MVFLFVFLVFILILLIFSKIQIQIDNLSCSSNRIRHINKDYQIIIKLLVFSKIPIFKYNITKTKLEKLRLKEKVRNMDFKILKNRNKFDKKMLKATKKINISIKKIKLYIELGTENASLTSIIIPIVSTVIANIFYKKVENYKNQNFTIKPIYINQNLINILIDGIFEIKMIHIINIIYILNKKEGVKKYERTSNRRSYDYSYE